MWRKTARSAFISANAAHFFHHRHRHRRGQNRFDRAIRGLSVREKNPQVLCMSALLTTTMPAMKSTIVALETAGVRRQVKVLIGGAPVTGQYAKEIGADGYSENATGAVSLVKELLGQRAA